MYGNVYAVQTYYGSDKPSLIQYYARLTNAKKAAKKRSESHVVSKSEVCLVNAVYTLDDGVLLACFKNGQLQREV